MENVDLLDANLGFFDFLKWCDVVFKLFKEVLSECIVVIGYFYGK